MKQNNKKTKDTWNNNCPGSIKKDTSKKFKTLRR